MDREDQLKIELNVLLDEYKALKAEIVSNLNSARQIVSLTLTAIGALIAVSKYIVESGAISVFLIAPLFFYALAWTQLRYVFLVLDMGAYLRKNVAQRIRAIMVELSSKAAPELQPGSKFTHILKWEELGRSPINRFERGIPESPTRFKKKVLKFKGKVWKLLFLPIAGSNYGIPLLASIVSLVTFCFLSSEITKSQLILLAIDVIGLLYSLGWGWKAEKQR